MIPYENKSRVTKYIGGMAIPAGETRPIDPRFVPGIAPAKEKPEPEPEPDFIAVLQAGTAASIKQAILDLSAGDLAKLQILEAESSTPRSTVLDAIAKEGLERANFIQEVNQAKPDELIALSIKYSDRKGFMDIIEQKTAE